MILNIRLGKDVDSTWQQRIRRQVYFKLTSKAPVIRVLTVDFSPNQTAESTNLFTCSMHAQLHDGSTEQVQLSGLPNMCIADSAARLSRALNRKAKHRAARWRATAQR